MGRRVVTNQIVEEYCQWLYQNEKSEATIQKYRHCLRQFQIFLRDAEVKSVDKQAVLLWKEAMRRNMSPSTVNGALAAANGLFRHVGWDGCIVQLIRIRQRIFCGENGELSRDEYERLIEAARDSRNERMELLLQTVCATGIRISELPFITVEALENHYTEVDCKGKIRRIFLVEGLCQRLKEYCRKKEIKQGTIFITRNGRPMDRSNIWRDMKKLAVSAGVTEEKVFPHNLRHLFARVFYNTEKDLLRLSDILGHSSINTTRIYTMESGETHMKQLEALDLLPKYDDRIGVLL